MDEQVLDEFKSKFQIHYYFEDISAHSMNALIRHKAEKDVFDSIKRICELLKLEYLLETEAYEEGGLKEKIVVVILGTATYFSPFINDLLIYRYTTDFDSLDLDKKVKKERLKELIFTNAVYNQKGLDKENLETDLLETLKSELEAVLEDRQTTRYISSYYKKITSDQKITKVGFSKINIDSREIVVPRESFNNFIVHDDTEVIIDDEAKIEVIAPVLNEGTYKWKGLYNTEKIDFSMGDAKFKKDVVNGKYKFSNGSFIVCVLQITSRYDDFGDIIQSTYSVQSVLDVTDTIGQNRKTIKGRLKSRQDHKNNQKNLFD